MAKKVEKLKKKHRPWIWVDRDGVLWFWEWKPIAGTSDWVLLIPHRNGWEVDDSIPAETKGPWEDGPFTRLHKNPYWDQYIEWVSKEPPVELGSWFQPPQMPAYAEMMGQQYKTYATTQG